MNKKILIGIITALFGGTGAWLLLRDKEEPLSPLAEKGVGVHYAGGGAHMVEGTVSLPNPCYALSVAAEKQGRAPEKVVLRFLARETGDVCVQVIYEAPFRIGFEAPDNAVLSATINDVPMALELERKLRVSVLPGEEFIVAENEDRWIEDLKVTFLTVEDDSRCPSDVQCIQAGWVTVNVQAGNEQIRLRLPGDASVPNAAVTGSYIITLVDIAPYPKSTEKIKQYTATLRVEVHDAKG